MEILYAALVLGGMGLLFGGLLTLTSKIFAVPANPKRDAVRELLPSANCGACGYPGCDGCADAIVSGKACVNACPVGGAETAAKIGEVMGVKPADPSTRLVARVICKGHNEHCKDKFDYKGINDCVAASLVSDGPRSCKYACIGMGSCVRACAFDAIHMDENRHIALIDENKCVGCGLCAEKCPRHCITMKVREHTRDRNAKVGTTPEVVKAAKPVTPAEKPARTPEMEAKIQAALAAKAAREAAAKAGAEEAKKPEA